MARLIQLHFETHPKRVAERFGVSESYARQQWRTFTVDEMATLMESLEAGKFK